ncbi:hypothetical protein BLNAU_20803 [Blattamonas nauphoetae]|uniref:Uncharacterized protein n=1 Tax=Blattamonas nauphoetae TaxID=2049346 RepID=A0ABQ9WY63_9EUKA|nr:hypothetical protein BLNAU_20803 [Blattamonas nauphoetae]
MDRPLPPPNFPLVELSPAELHARLAELERLNAIHLETIQHQKKVIQQQDETIQEKEKVIQLKDEEMKLDQRREANQSIVKAQSQTINEIRPIFQHFSPRWFIDLDKHISNFFLLNDGHILFSKTWLKNDQDVLSTPLIFRPIYNIVLHEILKFIKDHFAPDSTKKHSGGIFYVAGDQGIGKTSLMLIVMSALSHKRFDFHYEKGLKGDRSQHFYHKIKLSGDFDFMFVGNEISINKQSTIFIHIHDDSPPPESIAHNHLYIIFTSPDQKRLELPQLASDQLCRVFRLPTFSLAEDAAVMVGCTPTAPFALLSPEDMELRKDEQRILVGMEEEKEKKARDLPFQKETTPITSKNAAAKELLELFTIIESDKKSRWFTFLDHFQNRLTKWIAKTAPEQPPPEMIKPPSLSSPPHPASTVAPPPSTHPIQACTDPAPPADIQPTPAGLGNPAPAVSQAEPTLSSLANQVIQVISKKKADMLKAKLEKMKEAGGEGPKPKSKKEAGEKVAQPKSKKQAGGQVAQPKSKKETDREVPKLTSAKETEGEDPKLTSETKADREDTKSNSDKETDSTDSMWSIEIEADSEDSKSTGEMEEGRKDAKSNSEKKSDGTDPKSKSEEDAHIHNFYMSLCQAFLDLKDQQDEHERLHVIVDWLINNLEIHENRDKTQATFIKDLLRELIYTEWEKLKTESDHKQEENAMSNEGTPPNQNGQQNDGTPPNPLDEAALKQKIKDDIETKKTTALFAFAMNCTPRAPDLQPGIQRFSESIQKANLIGLTPSSGQSNEPAVVDATLETQLASLKTHFAEPTIVEMASRQEVRDEVKKISQQVGKVNKERRELLFSSLIDMLGTPPPFYDTNKHTLQSLFVLPKMEDQTIDTEIRDTLDSLLIDSDKPSEAKDKLHLILKALLQSLLDTQIDTDTPSPPQSNVHFKRRMARIACDLLSTIVDPKHDSVEKRLEAVTLEMESVRDRRSFILLMDSFSSIARNMNILVSPHSILKGLSERPEKPSLDLIFERQRVFFRNVRDDGLSDWVKAATEALRPHRHTTDHDSEEKVVDTAISFIRDNLNKLIVSFNKLFGEAMRSKIATIISTSPKNAEQLPPVVPQKWLPIVRSMMNTILFLVDAGFPRREMLTQFRGLGKLLNSVYMDNRDHLLNVANYEANLVEDEKEEDENVADYVNDLNVFSKHFGAQKSLNTLKLPRTLQIKEKSQDRLERISIALFARNLLCFLTMDDSLPFDNQCYVDQFFNVFLPELNPGDVVHRSFVDFMNETRLLSQERFGLGPESVSQRLPWKVVSPMPQPFESPKVRHPSEPKADVMRNEHDPFDSLFTPKIGVHLLLWASTDLLWKAACRAASQISEVQRTASCLNLARASIFGPSPRWLTSTDARTNRGLVFLWDGVLRSENTKALMDVADSNHSRIMEFKTRLIYFEQSLNAAWDDITALVPLLSAYGKENTQPSDLRSVYSLMVRRTAETIEKMKSQIRFLAVSPFVEQIMQSEVVSAFARLLTQKDYETFRQHQLNVGFKLPDRVEEPLVCISFLLNCPAPISFCHATTSFSNHHFHLGDGEKFSKYFPFFETNTKKSTSIPMLTFPTLLNKSVPGTKFPEKLAETKRGTTDFYSENLQKVKGGTIPGIDSLIVSRGSDATSETIFMSIQVTCSDTHSLQPKGIMKMQQLLFQAMCHLEVSEEIVAIYNYATTQEIFDFPSRTGILGFHMVSSLLQFGKDTLTHMPSVFRHRDRPLVTTPPESLSTITTQTIADTLLANLGHYPTFSTKHDVWTTTLPKVINPPNPSITLPFQWKSFYDRFYRPVTKNEQNANDWRDRLIRRTMQELHRIGVGPDDLGVSDEARTETFSSFLLCSAISCRRNDLLCPTAPSTPLASDDLFVKFVASIARTEESPAIKTTLAPLETTKPDYLESVRHEKLKQLNNLCRLSCIEAKVHTVSRIMMNNAMTRLRNPLQECLSVIQSKQDGGVFRVPTRNNLSAILHCGTVLLDNITPLSDTITTQTASPSLSSLTTPFLTANQTMTPHSNSPLLSSIAPKSSPRSRTLRIPLHSFILAKYGFSDSIPDLYKLNKDDVWDEVTNVLPAPLIRWQPRRVVIDRSLLPPHLQEAEWLSSFTSFIHRLFDNPFIPVTTSLSATRLEDDQTNTFLLSQIGKMYAILSKVDLRDVNQDDTKFTGRLKKLESILDNGTASEIFSFLPTIRSSLNQHPLPLAQSRPVLAAVESIEAIQLQPILVFAKTGSDLFKSKNQSAEIVDTKTPSHLFPNESAEIIDTKTPSHLFPNESAEIIDTKTPSHLFPNESAEIIDTKTPSHLFPIPFSAGYKEGDIRAEMQQIYDQMTSLVPDRFPVERVTLSHPPKASNNDRRMISASTNEEGGRAGTSMDSDILDQAKASTSPLFVCVVDEDLADHESLPMSLRSADETTSCGVMRQRSIADVLWILFLTRITREVMALSLNTSMKGDHFKKYVMQFISTVLYDCGRVGEDDAKDIAIVLDTLTSRAAEEGFDSLDEHPSIGIELLVSAFPHVTEPSHTLPLSRLLMLCKPHPNGKSRLDALFKDPSPKVELVSLTRWFELLSAHTKQRKLKDVIKRGDFHLSMVHSNLLHAFYLLIEHPVNTRVKQLLDSIKPLFKTTPISLIFSLEHKQTADELNHLIDELFSLAEERRKICSDNPNRSKLLLKVKGWFYKIQGALLKTSPNSTKLLPT